MVAASPIDSIFNPNAPAQRYVLWNNGRIDAIGGAVPVTDQATWYDRFEPPGRAIWVTNWTTGSGYVLDYRGGFNPFGGAPALGLTDNPTAVAGIPITASPAARRYVDWSWDPAGTGQGYVLDQWGELLPFGGAVSGPRAGRRFTWGAAKKLQMRWTPDKRAVQMDMYGYLRPEWSQPAITDQGAVWLNHDYARDFVVTDWTTFGGYKLNLYGGLHAFGSAGGAFGAPQRVGADVARCLQVTSASNPLTTWIVWSNGASFDVVSSTAPSVTAGGGSSETQKVTITGAPTGGTFTLTFNGQTTGTIAWNATAATVQTALRALSGIGSTGVTVTGGPGPATAWTVAFGGSLAKTDVSQMTATSSLTGGTTPAVTVTTTVAGINASPALTVTDTSRPTLGWSYSDLQDDTQAAWQVLVFTQAFVTGHTMTNPLTWTSSALVSVEGVDPTARGVTCPVDLVNGAYVLYVRVQDTAKQWSAWDSHSWTQNVPAPATPTSLTATVNATTYTTALSVSATTGGSASLVRFECSDDAGVTWLPVRGADALPIATTVTATDQDVPQGIARQYRAIAYNTDPAVASAPSNVATVTLSTATYLLTAVDDATLGGTFRVQEPVAWTRTGSAGVFEGLGADYPTVVKDSGKSRSRRSDVEIFTDDKPTFVRLETMVMSRSTLVYRDPFGGVRYCEYVGDWSAELFPGAALRHIHTVRLPLLEVAPPHLAS